MIELCTGLFVFMLVNFVIFYLVFRKILYLFAFSSPCFTSPIKFDEPEMIASSHIHILQPQATISSSAINCFTVL